MKTCNLQEIIYLPSNVFSNTNIKTCIFIFTKIIEGTDVLEINETKTKRTYKFIKEHNTETIKFSEFDITLTNKTELIEVKIKDIILRW